MMQEPLNPVNPVRVNTVTTYQKDSTSSCWVNTFVGEQVLVTFPVGAGVVGGATCLSGLAARIDKFEYRYYLVLIQNAGTANPHEVHINIDHIMTIEEK